MRNSKGLWALALALDLLMSCQRATPPVRTADHAYSLRQIIRAQQLIYVHPCNPGSPTVVSEGDIAQISQALQTNREFLQSVLGIKLLPPPARVQLLQDSRSIRVACAGTTAPAATTAEQRLADAIATLADRMADRTPGPEIESTIIKLPRRR